MKESLQKTLDSYLSILDTLRKSFRWEHELIYPVAANLFAWERTNADVEKIKDCKKLVKQSVGIFSSFRGNLMFPLACMLSLDPEPERKWERALDSYAALKQHFWGSEYLALAAVAMGEAENNGEMESVAQRGRALYDRMKKEHPFLTGSEDSVFAVLLAQSEKSDDDLIADMEACYQILDAKFPKGNGMQSASHILSLSPGAPEEKANRVISLYEKIIGGGGKFGKNYELPVLCAVSAAGGDADELVTDILETAEKLRAYKKYRGVFGYDRKTRYMHAAMLVTTDRSMQAGEGNSAAQIAASQSALSVVIAQEIAMCAIIASTAASSAASSAH